MTTGTVKARARGKLKIGDDWNAITIIALSQSNPLKAIAELVENSIDAKARKVTITRGREYGRHFLAIRDDGEGVPRDQGLPGYTFERAPAESWRSKFDAVRHVIVVNSGHRDFVYASRSKSLKLRYLVRLYAKELVLRNFVGLPADQLLERMVELSLRTEEHL